MYALLEKTKVLGSNKQVNSILSLVIGLIFVSVLYPKMVLGNLILFLTIALVVVFVTLLLWGFATGSELTAHFAQNKTMKIIIGIFTLLVVIFAVFWATGTSQSVFDLLFSQSWSESFWTNFAFIVVIIVAIVVAMKGASPAKG